MVKAARGVVGGVEEGFLGLDGGVYEPHAMTATSPQLKVDSVNVVGELWSRLRHE